MSESHCSNCGRPRKSSAANDGYSECCNNRICMGPGFGFSDSRFACRKAGNYVSEQPEIIGQVEACCVAAAQAKADRHGWEVAWREA